ncbi:hypothetical protein Rhopal_002827-T1 [Rhodotorula paludigena]|uniref:GRF-type domain-containing protein n=1 Tax=Rhodotorula paludigena TaxID=86838 RepID=A0AAV5GHV6_9BASI|nr:hypothetical protein Rhopal_002827-T1 [Rhodotorula paludigena]
MPRRTPQNSPKKTLTGASPRKRENKYLKYECFGPDGVIYCFCDRTPRREAVRRITQTNRHGNEGRPFYACDDQIEQCDFFLWEDMIPEVGGPAHMPGEGHCLDDDDDEGWGGHGGGRTLGDGYITPPTSSQGMSRTPSSDLPKTPAKSKSDKKRARSPSPDWPDTVELERELRRAKREAAAFEREKKLLQEQLVQREKALEALASENSQLLKEVHPELFGQDKA